MIKVGEIEVKKEEFYQAKKSIKLLKLTKII